MLLTNTAVSTMVIDKSITGSVDVELSPGESVELAETGTAINALAALQAALGTGLTTNLRGATTSFGDFSNDPATTKNGRKAQGFLTFTDQPANTQTITVGSRTYTFQTTLTNVIGNVKIGATALESFQNLVAAIVGGAGSGTKYAALTTANTEVVASVAGNLVTFTAILASAAANNFVTTETLTYAAFSAAKMLGGSDIVYGFFGGKARDQVGAVTTFVGGTVVVTDAATGYVYLTPAGVAFDGSVPSGAFCMANVSTTNGVLTTADQRALANYVV